MISTNYINTYQFGDQLSWNHGKHALRFGFDGERILYNNTIPACRPWRASHLLNTA